MFAKLICGGSGGGGIFGDYCKYVGLEPVDGPCLWSGDTPVGGHCGNYGADPIGSYCSLGYWPT